MKKFLIFSMIFMAFACSSPLSEVDELLELTKKYTIEKLELPKGTQFNDDLISIKKYEENNNSENGLYSVTIVVKTQDKEGAVLDQTHVLLYKKNQDSENNEHFELISFE